LPDEIFTDDERKINDLEAHHASYITCCEDANLMVSDETLLSMQKYFQKIWMHEQ
jgi:hypothetical protein